MCLLCTVCLCFSPLYSFCSVRVARGHCPVQFPSRHEATRPVSSQNKKLVFPSSSKSWLCSMKDVMLHHHCRLLTKVCCAQHMFPVLRSIYRCLVGIKTSSKVSWDIVNETWSNSLRLLLQHEPSQGNNKQMSGVGTAPSERRQVLKRGGLGALVPRLQGGGVERGGGGTAGLSLTVTSHRLQLEKPDRSYRYLSLFSPVRRPLRTRTHIHTRLQVWTHTHTHTESETTRFVSLVWAFLGGCEGGQLPRRCSKPTHTRSTRVSAGSSRTCESGTLPESHLGSFAVTTASGAQVAQSLAQLFQERDFGAAGRNAAVILGRVLQSARSSLHSDKKVLARFPPLTLRFVPPLLSGKAHFCK